MANCIPRRRVAQSTVASGGSNDVRLPVSFHSCRVPAGAILWWVATLCMAGALSAPVLSAQTGVATGEDWRVATAPVVNLIYESLGSPRLASLDGRRRAAGAGSHSLEDVARTSAGIARTLRQHAGALSQDARAASDIGRAASDFEFLLATVPDYVDSNTSWMADEILGAIQAAFPNQGYVLERFYLSEVPESRATGAKNGQSAAGESRSPGASHDHHLHETQPGALVFRGDGGTKVVFIVLETPTSGLHVRAFNNAVQFIAEWQRVYAGGEPSPAPIELRIVGPTFSGSVPMMTSALAALVKPLSIASLVVVSGSATDDGNAEKFDALCRAGRPQLVNCSYGSAMHSNHDTAFGLLRYLDHVSPSWLPAGVAVFQEANTSFGQGFNPKAGGTCVDERRVDSTVARDDTWFNRVDACVHRYYFPLHIAQLRDDNRSAPALPSLLSAPAAALHLGERITPVDLVPPMRPDIASPVTDLTVASMLDDIRHHGFAAVGIYASDVRDTLFLSREIKRAAPDVQLFYPSAHLLFLHRDFVAYTRGAIVASTYPLSTVHQIWGADNGSETDAGVDDDLAHAKREGNDQLRHAPVFSPFRETFVSTVAQGVFNATLSQLGGQDYLPDYPPQPSWLPAEPCSPTDPTAPRHDCAGDPPLGAKPGIWLSVVGDDGFWPLEQSASNNGTRRLAIEATGWPLAESLVAITLIVVAALHLLVAFVRPARRVSERPSSGGALDRVAGARLHTTVPTGWIDIEALRRLPWLRAFAPLPQSHELARIHSAMCALALSVVLCVAGWVATVALVYVTTSGLLPGPATWWLFPVLASVGVGLSPTLRALDWAAWSQKRTTSSAGRIRAGLWLTAVCVAFPCAALLRYVVTAYWDQRAVDGTALLVAARTVGGGIVSPAATTLCLMAAIYAPLLWSVRRLSTLGRGHSTLATSSSSFRELFAAGSELTRLIEGLESPGLALPRSYWLGLVAIAAALVQFLARHVATVEGQAFTLFLNVTSGLGHVAALVLLLRTLAVWRQLKKVLRRMARVPANATLERPSAVTVRAWRLSLTAPTVAELLPVVHAADELRRRLQDPLAAPALPTLFDTQELGLRVDALLTGEAAAEIRGERTGVSLGGSAAWSQLWHLSNALVPAVTARRTAALGRMDQFADPGSRDTAACAVLNCAERILDAQCSLVLRTATACLLSSMAAGMVAVGLLICGHLVYVFQGRSSLLTADMVVFLIGSLISVSVLVGLETDTVLAAHRRAAGHLRFDWAFAQRIFLYGVVPLVVVLGSLFPEVGETLVRVVEPLRKLTSF